MLRKGGSTVASCWSKNTGDLEYQVKALELEFTGNFSEKILVKSLAVKVSDQLKLAIGGGGKFGMILRTLHFQASHGILRQSKGQREACRRDTQVGVRKYFPLNTGFARYFPRGLSQGEKSGE